MKKKSIIVLVFMLLLAVLINYVAFFGYNIAGFTYGGMFDEEKGIRKGIDLAGGSVITFQADYENPTEDQMNIVESIFTARLNNAGYTEARISKDETGQITVEIPSVFETDEAAGLLGSTAQLSFVDADGNVVLDGATDIKNAEAMYGPVGTAGVSEHYVQLTLTSEAIQKFADATRAAVALKGEGKNFIAIKMDDAILSQPRVEEEINSETCIISGSFETAADTQTLANQIKSGALPFALSVITQNTIGAELGESALPTSLLAAGIGILVVMLFMIIMYRIPGLIADLALLFYVGLIALFMGILRVN